MLLTNKPKNLPITDSRYFTAVIFRYILNCTRNNTPPKSKYIFSLLQPIFGPSFSKRLILRYCRSICMTTKTVTENNKLFFGIVDIFLVYSISYQNNIYFRYNRYFCNISVLCLFKEQQMERPQSRYRKEKKIFEPKLNRRVALISVRDSFTVLSIFFRYSRCIIEIIVNFTFQNNQCFRYNGYFQTIFRYFSK